MTQLFVVSGAPGSGKTTTLNAFIKLGTPYLAFDIDWLADVASVLVGKDIYTDASSWPAYGRLWWTVLEMAMKNGRTPIFFTPNDAADLRPLPAWCSGIQWLLLDCPEEQRRERLCQRPGWGKDMIDEAVADGVALRAEIPLQLNTAVLSPAEIAQEIEAWVMRQA